MSKHVMMNYSLIPNKNKIWWTMNDMMKNYHRLMIIFKMMKALAKWFIKTNLLPMFSLAKNQLYWRNLMIKRFDDVKFKISRWWWNNMKTSRCCCEMKKFFISKSIDFRIFFPSFSVVVDSSPAWTDSWLVTYRRMK